MAEEEPNKLSNEGPAEESSSSSADAEHPEGQPEGRARHGRSVATLEVTEGPFANVSIDTFAVPSERPVERNDDVPQA